MKTQGGAPDGERAGRSEMLRMTVNTEEYIQIGDDIRIVFLGGSRNHTRVMLDVPKEIKHKSSDHHLYDYGSQ